MNTVYDGADTEQLAGQQGPVHALHDDVTCTCACMSVWPNPGYEEVGHKDTKSARMQAQRIFAMKNLPCTKHGPAI